MTWDFFTAMSVVSGGVLVLASLGGAAVGPVRERCSLGALGTGSIAYGVWVANQTSGIYFFSVAPMALAVVIVVRAARKVVDSGGSGTDHRPAQPTEASLGSGVPPAAANYLALRDACSKPLREAIHARSQYFTPAFGLLKATGERADGWAPLGLSWSRTSDVPDLAGEEELRTVWRCRARVKVAVGPDLGPTRGCTSQSWVTVFDGTGIIAVTNTSIVGIVTAGESILGRIDREVCANCAMWRLPLDRCSSVEPEHGDAILLSSTSPASRVRLSELRYSDGQQAELNIPAAVALLARG